MLWLFFGCTPPAAVPPAAVSSPAPPANAAAPALDTAQTADTATTASDPTPAWSAAPPDAQVGDQITLVATCGLLDGPMTAVLAYDGLRYQGIQVEAYPRADLVDCFALLDGLVIAWSHEPAIHLSASGWSHTLVPSANEGDWYGTTSPLRMTEACLDQLDAAGMAWPVPLVATVTAVDPSL